MNIEGEIWALKEKTERHDVELEEVGLLLNTRGDLKKIYSELQDINKRLKSIEKSQKEDYRIKLFRKKK